MENLIKKMMEAATLPEYEAASKACIEYMATATDEERQDIKEAIKQKTNSIILESNETRKQVLEYFDRIKVKILPL